MRFIEIDGSYGEGGGQIIRTAVGLSGATRTPIRVINIRSGRPRPGISHQHLHAIRAVQNLTNAKVEGLELGSGELTFIPSKIVPGSYNVDIGTAGSVSLVLQTFLIPSIFTQAEIRIVISGGTDAPMSPSIDYIKNVFLRQLAKMGANVEITVKRRGHYPKGGGLIDVVVKPSSIHGLRIEKRGNLKGIYGVSHCNSLPEHVATRQKNAAIGVLKENLKQAARIEVEMSQGFGVGSGIVLWAAYENTVVGASSLGERKKIAEIVGREAAEHLLVEISSDASVDSYMGDQLIPYLALTGGVSSYICKLTSHTKTNLYITESILGTRFDITHLGDMTKITRKKS